MFTVILFLFLFVWGMLAVISNRRELACWFANAREEARRERGNQETRDWGQERWDGTDERKLEKDEIALFQRELGQLRLCARELETKIQSDPSPHWQIKLTFTRRLLQELEDRLGSYANLPLPVPQQNLDDLASHPLLSQTPPPPDAERMFGNDAWFSAMRVKIRAFARRLSKN